MKKDEKQGLLRGHELLREYFEELAAQHDQTMPWQILKRRHIIMQTRALKELGRRMVAMSKQQPEEAPSAFLTRPTGR
jgi:uncharacterized protein (UPF0371 family)